MLAMPPHEVELRKIQVSKKVFEEFLRHTKPRLS